MTTDILDVARQALAHGYCPIPPKTDGTKAPAGRWKQHQHELPTVDQIETAFAQAEGIGLVCGTVSGNLEMLELEGRATHLWKPFVAACRTAGLGDLIERIATGYAETTPSGGLHLLYRCDGPVDGNLKLARQLDPDTGEIQVLLETRGEGGYVVIAPSNGATHPTGQPWVLKAGSLETVATITVDERAALLEVARGFDQMPAPAGPVEGDQATLKVGPPRLEGDSWMTATQEAFNQATSWRQLLEPAGWTFHHRQGDVDHWTRPGKDPKHGHSATVNAKGTDRLIVHSSSVAGFELSPTSYDRFGAWAVLQHGGDRQQAALTARADGHGPPLEQLTVVDEAGLAQLAAGNPGPVLMAARPTLPDGFWDRRPQLAHIRQAAHSRNRSADVVLHGVLARVAACTPHTLEIPPIVGAPGSLNYFAAIEGPSGSGKSSGAHIAGELIPTPGGLDLVDDQPLGSGEGIADLYMGTVEEEGPGGKPRTVRKQTRWNAFVYGDEGAALTNMMDRKGATLTETLRRAWTGAALGQANATAERKRVIKGGQYRLGLLIGFQPELAGRLIADHIAGTPQRFLWATAIDPHVPDTPPDWPGHLDWTPPSRAELEQLKVTGTGGYIRHRLTIDPDIATQIRTDDLARVRGQTVIDELDAHRPLHLLKTAALLAILDQRLHIATEDWQLAHTIWDTSNAVRAHVQRLVALEAEREKDRRITDHADRELVAEAARLTATDAIARVAALIARKLHDAGDDGPLLTPGHTRKQINRHVAGRDKHLIDPALDHAIALGWITDNDSRYRPGESRPA